jgi:hypothetical protein
MGSDQQFSVQVLVVEGGQRLSEKLLSQQRMLV